MSTLLHPPARAALGDSVADTLRQDQRAAFIPAARSFAGPLPGPAVERTAVAHLDTAPDAPPGPQGMLSPTSPGRDDHGFVMRSLLQDLVCDGNNCLADIRSWLALPNINDHDVDYVNGGSYGRRGYLAQKLFAAVETWKIEAARGGPSRLVIPLALGWAEDPHIAPADSSPTKAVFDTLFHADCHGVLVLAAAGTGTGGKSPASGPLLPAAWESTVVRPDIKACDDAGDLPVFFKDATLNREYLTAHPVFEMPIQIHKNLPIVLSVGGIDYSDRPIAPTRPRSLTNLVALGSFGGGTVGAIPLPQSRTGTSIAVMVAGAAAAAMWAYLPSLTGAEIEDWLLLTRLPLPPIDPTQDVCAGSGCAFLGRLSFCESLARVLHLANRAQPACVHLATPRANPSPSPLVINRLSALRWPSLTSYLKPMTPGEQSPGADAPPWVYPQPTKPGCTICLLDVVDKKLYGAFDAVQPNDLTLVVDTTQGLKTFGLSGAGNGPFSAEFNDLDLSQWQSTARTAWLTWTTNNADTGVSVAAQEQIPLF